jgi:hypothetical protein
VWVGVPVGQLAVGQGLFDDDAQALRVRS